MLPKPIYTGGSPSSKNLLRLSGGLNDEARSRNTKPAISISEPQSGGFGIKPIRDVRVSDLNSRALARTKSSADERYNHWSDQGLSSLEVRI